MKNQIDLFFNFIKLKTPNLKEVLDVKIKDFDDENGFIGQHYVVKCLLKVPDTRTPLENMLGEKEYLSINQKRTCLVNREVFNEWVKNKESVKWI